VGKNSKKLTHSKHWAKPVRRGPSYLERLDAQDCHTAEQRRLVEAADRILARAGAKTK